jgi:hypothetical protein
MTLLMKGTLGGLALLVVGACTGGGLPNELEVGPSDAPTDPGAPGDPNAPPADPHFPPFGGTAPPGPSVPGSGATGGDCKSICDDFGLACGEQEDSEAIQECVTTCKDLPERCLSEIAAVFLCYVDNDCDDEDNCDAEALALARCVGPG